jgi:4-hydroxy-3-methylbut-2-enyl diphosphate reductase
MTIDQNQTPAEADTNVTPEAIQAPDIEAVTTDAVVPTVDTPDTSSDVAEAALDSAISTPEAPVADAPAVEAVPAEAPTEAVAEVVETAPAVEEASLEPVAVATEPQAAEVPSSDAVANDSAAVAALANEAPAPAPVVEAVEEPVNAGVSVDPGGMDLFDAFMSGNFAVDGDGAEGGFKRLSKGERIEATVIQIENDRVFVNLGTKSEGILPLEELSDENLTTAIGQLTVGQKINVVVLRPEGAEGNPIVSKKRADFEEVWDRVERAHQSQETLNAMVVDRVKGGLVVDVGVRGFVPATHVGSGKLRNIEKYVGQVLSLKVLEIDRDRRKVVLSNRVAEEENKAAAKEAIFTTAKPGDILEGTVRRLADYGAFVDLGGVDGLLHISEMSWARINHPKEMFKEGQEIKVMVLRLDPSVGKISLGHRQVLPDPWNLIKDNYRKGQKLTVNISRIVQSGAFIRLPEGAEAFMPVSEMSVRRIRKPQDVVEEGQVVEAEIIDLRTEDRRMVLSMRSLGGGAELRPGAEVMEDDGRGMRGRRNSKTGRREGDDDDASGSRRGGFSSGGATIGERLGMLKGLLNREEPAEEKGDGAAEEPAEA